MARRRNKKRGHRGGIKMAKHTTLIDNAEEVVDFLIKLREVKKISAGGINRSHNNKPRVDVKNLTGGLKVIVRGPRAAQDLYVYSGNVPATKKSLEENFCSNAA